MIRSKENISDMTKILVAEDEEYNFLFIEALLADMNLEVFHAQNGKEAVDICNENPTISLILMDIKMPIMDGCAAASQIKTIRPNLPIVAQSAYSVAECSTIYGDTVFDDYVNKPIKGILLKELIKKYLNNSTPMPEIVI